MNEVGTEEVMPASLPDPYRRVLRDELAAATEQGALGVMLCGSVARGTARPTSDLDLRLYWPQPRPFVSERRGDIVVERHGHTFAQAEAQVGWADTQLYAWTEGLILHDPHGVLAGLQGRARLLLGEYRTPEAERRALRHWLVSTLDKLAGTTDEAQVAFLVQTTLWKLAEGLCAVNDRPAPPSTLMWELLPTLPQQPERWTAALLLGMAAERRETFLRVAGWVLEMLAPEPPGA